MYNNWICKKCGLKIVEVDYDYDCHAYECYHDDMLIGTVYPADVQACDSCRESLNAGECPVCDGWEDGMGNTCLPGGWGRD